MNTRETLDEILGEVNGKMAWEWVRIITGYHRIKASKGYEQIAKRIEEYLNTMGLDSVEIHEFPADGTTKSWDWVPSYGWDATSAELWITSPEKKRICSFEEVPLCLVTHSKACDISGELVDIGTIESDVLLREDLAGKFLLFEGAQYPNMKDLMGVGALGVISYPTAARIGNNNDIHIYDAYLPDATGLENLTCGFSLTRDQGLALKRQLSKGKVTLHAKIDAEIYPSTLKVLDATLKGTENPEETVLIMGHLCHPSPGANDNASGAAGVLEAARSLMALIADGRMRRPKRSIEFLWVDEYMATAPWTERFQEKLESAICCINLDMIGENQMKLDSQFYTSLAGYSTPSILNDLILEIVPKIAQDSRGVNLFGTKAPMRSRTIPYSGGSDHTVFNDAFFGIPGIMIGHQGDNYYHSSRDELEMCDPTELQRSIVTGVWLGYVMANFSLDKISDIIGILDNGRYSRKSKLSNLLHQLEDKIRNPDLSDANYQEICGFALELIQAFVTYEEKILQSLGRFGTISEAGEKYTSEISSEIDFWKKTHIKSWSSCGECRNRETKHEFFISKYRSLIDGPIALEKLEECEKSDEYKDITANRLNAEIFGAFTLEIYNFAVGGFSTAQIAALICLEYNLLIFPSEIKLYLDGMIRLNILERQDHD